MHDNRAIYFIRFKKLFSLFLLDKNFFNFYKIQIILAIREFFIHKYQ